MAPKRKTPIPRLLAPLDGTLRQGPDGNVRFLGIDYETSKMRIIGRTDTHLVIRLPGRSCWNGNGAPRLYRGAATLVFKIMQILSNGDMVLEGVVDIPLRTI